MEINEELMTLTEFIRVANQNGLEMSARRYRQLAAEGTLPSVKAGKVDAMLAAVKIAAYYDGMRTRKEVAPTLTDERARLLKATADLKELELRKTEGELIDTGEAMYLWGGLMELTRARLMTVPEELSLALEGCTSPAEAEAISRAIIHRVLNELSDPSLRDVVRAAEQTI